MTDGFEKTICGIYSITNQVNGKIYIGQSVNIFARWKNHLTGLYGGYHTNKHLQNSFDKYGENNFDFNIIKVCKPLYLDRFEKLYIRIFDTLNQEKGYNKIAGGNENKKYSSESKENISKGLKKYYKENPQALEKMRQINLGKKGYVPSLNQRISKSKKVNSSGIFRVSKHFEKIKLKKGFRWRYAVTENNENKTLQSTNLYDLKLKVLEEGYPWIEFTEEGSELVEEEKKVYNPYSNYPNPSGYFRVSKIYDKKYKQGFIWTYNYFEEGHRKKISSVDIGKLEKKVKDKGLIWHKIGEVV